MSKAMTIPLYLHERIVTSDIKFWVPLILSSAITIVMIVVQQNQRRRIEQLKGEVVLKSQIHRIQFEKEFEIYTIMWKMLNEFRISIVHLSSEVNWETEVDNHLSRVNDAYSKFWSCLEYFNEVKPFFPNDIYEVLRIIVNDSLPQMQRMKRMKEPINQNESFWVESKDNLVKIEGSIDEVLQQIRNRINPAV